MLKISDLSCVRGDRELFAALTLEVNAGEVLHVCGPNGCGKTSLLRMMCGLMQPQAGEISWADQPISELEEEYFQEVAYLGHALAVKAELNALENLRFACSIAGTTPDDAALSQALERFGLVGLLELPTRILSQGQKRRVALARFLLTRAKLWIMDEPFTALDNHAITLLRDVIVAHLDRGGMVVLTTHQDIPIAAARVKTLDLEQQP